MNALDAIVTAFKDNVPGVHKLINFDREALDLAIGQIRVLHERLKTQQRIDNPDLNGAKLLTFLTGIQDNNFLRTRYQTIVNQAVVLLVLILRPQLETCSDPVYQ